MSLTPAELDAIYLTVALASLTTIILLILGTPLAWWLAYERDLGLRGLISYFMALLELTRLRHLQLEQNDDFGDILVILREAA